MERRPNALPRRARLHTKRATAHEAQPRCTRRVGSGCPARGRTSRDAALCLGSGKGRVSRVRRATAKRTVLHVVERGPPVRLCGLTLEDLALIRGLFILARWLLKLSTFLWGGVGLFAAGLTGCAGEVVTESDDETATTQSALSTDPWQNIFAVRRVSASRWIANPVGSFQLKCLDGVARSECSVARLPTRRSLDRSDALDHPRASRPARTCRSVRRGAFTAWRFA